MKTAVSIPDDVFNEAEDFARRTNVSRSELYATALRALLAQDVEITRTLDRIYSAVPTDPAVTAAARRTLNKSVW